ncbi:MAG TPA: twin-arginine translocase TatA/TatE family subunit [Candidatus Chromulinivoraceae bacterium]|nr:twin-arginine translocase TatA/TatE family subunit [Candidatus Chromulinivoraceae bacterium]
MGKVEGLLILLAIILILFGAKKLPELARGVGESVRELKRGLNSSEDTVASKKDAAEEK